MEYTISQKAQKPARIYSFDWLRILAFAVVLIIHSMQMFGDLYTLPGGQKLNDTNDSFGFFIPFIVQWWMSLFFLLAGASAYLSLRNKSASQFIKARFSRLLIPFLIGCVLMLPLQGFFAAQSNNTFQGSLLDFYILCLSHILTGNFAWITEYIHHLWFLLYLFCFSLLTLPLCLYLRSENGSALLERVTTYVERTEWLPLLALPIILIQLVLRPLFPTYCSLTDILCWILFYMYGYAMQANPRFREAIKKQGKLILGLGVSGLLSVMLLLQVGALHNWITNPDYSSGSLIFQALSSIMIWSAVTLTLTLSEKSLTKNCSFLKYGSAASFPWYFVHFPLVVIAAYYVLPLHLNPIITFSIIIVSSLGATMITADFIFVRLPHIITIGTQKMQTMLAGNQVNQRAPYPEQRTINIAVPVLPSAFKRWAKSA